jgi:hypothetical protein
MASKQGEGHEKPTAPTMTILKAGQDAIAAVIGIDDNHFVTTYAMGSPGAGNVMVTIEAAG